VDIETFSDTHIKMEGPAVKDLETVFLNSLIANQEHIPAEYENSRCSLCFSHHGFLGLDILIYPFPFFHITPERSIALSRLWSGGHSCLHPTTAYLYRYVALEAIWFSHV
jgi:hypothetical protein